MDKKAKLNTQGRYSAMFSGMPNLAEVTPAPQVETPPEEAPTPPPAHAGAHTQAHTHTGAEVQRADAPPSPAKVKKQRYNEPKSRRLQMLIQPSLYEKVRVRAEREGISVNECIHSLIEAALRRAK